ncbi:MAG TPA: hypothetical protein VFK41_08855 [Nocardioidaceae bacterium]|nr:hypothetical protein [Nocardioidaceae bacterium]
MNHALHVTTAQIRLSRQAAAAAPRTRRRALATLLATAGRRTRRSSSSVTREPAGNGVSPMTMGASRGAALFVRR